MKSPVFGSEGRGHGFLGGTGMHWDLRLPRIPRENIHRKQTRTSRKLNSTTKNGLRERHNKGFFMTGRTTQLLAQPCIEGGHHDSSELRSEDAPAVQAGGIRRNLLQSTKLQWHDWHNCLRKGRAEGWKMPLSSSSYSTRRQTRCGTVAVTIWRRCSLQFRPSKKQSHRQICELNQPKARLPLWAGWL